MIPPAGGRPLEPKPQVAAMRDRAVTGLLIAALAVAAFAIGVPSVAVPSTAASAVPSGAAAPSPAAPVVYREGVVGRPSSITPVTARTKADRTLVGLIFSGLFKMGPGDTLAPDLASSWTSDKSGQVWTVTIRPDAVWQDGAPVTSEDVVYTISTLKDPAASGGQAAAWADVSVEALDSHTVRFTLGSPVGGFLAALRQPLLPPDLLEGVLSDADLATSEFALNPVGTGPYQLIQVDDVHAVLVPSATTAGGALSGSPGATDGVGPAGPGTSGAPSSGSGSPSDSGAPGASGFVAPSPSGAAGALPPGGSGAGVPRAAAGLMALAVASTRPTATPKATQSPKPTASPRPTPTPSPTPSPTPTPDPNARPVQQIELDFYDTEDELAAAFGARQIDGAADLTPATTRALGATPGTRILDYPTTTLSAVLLNLRPSHKELQDANVRKALLGAIDRTAIASSALGGQARVADTLIPPESWAYDPSKVVKVPYSTTQAVKLLQAAGWTRANGRWTAPKAKAPYKITLLTVSADVNPRLAAIATAVADAWTQLGLTVNVTTLSGTDLASRLQSGEFDAAVLDIAEGLEPDLYPLLDSTQVRSNGSNRSGYQDPAMDQLLEAARQNGTTAERQAAWSALLAGISARMPVLPIVWADEQAVVRGLSGVTPRLIVYPGDRFWDVLAWRLAATR